MERLLFTAGPVEVRRDVLESMSRQMITHRGADYKELHSSIVRKIKKLLGTDNDVLLVVSSATGVMEAAVRSAVSEKIAHLTCGAFGERWGEISVANGKRADVISFPWGEAVQTEKLDAERLGKDEAVAVTHNETSTGVMSPIEEIADFVHDNTDALLFVDAVTSAFANLIDMKRVRPDMLLFGTQKALALPPGLAVAVVSPRLLEKARSVRERGKYFDLLDIKEFADRDLVPSTPPVSLMYALDYQLDRIAAEGMEARAERHRHLAEMARRWAGEKLSLFPMGNYSNTVTCVNNEGRVDYKGIDSHLAGKGYQISEGYGRIKQSTFRIGHMGDLRVEEMKGLLDAMSEAV